MGENSKKIQPRAGEAAAEWVSLSSLRPWADNPRHNDGKPVEKVAESIKRFGFASPIIARADGEIIAGHTRYKAAQALGLDRVPVRFLDLDPADAHLLAVADNRLGEFAEWDTPKLQEILSDFSFDDAALAGYTQEDFDEWARELAALEVTEDEAPEVPKEPTTKAGDLWVLGDHRVLCGDATSAEDVERLMGGKTADLCVTDPPYGAEIEYATHDDTQEALVALIDGFFPLARAHSTVIALTSGINNMWHYQRPDWVLCWFYAAGTGRTQWGFSAWQPVLVWGKDPKLANGEGAHPDGFNWPMTSVDAEERREIDHVCPKPVSSWAKWIGRLSNAKTRLLYDPFLGSGTTLIAAEQLGLSCYGLEISPAYCDVIVERWENLTGGKAKRE